MRSDIALYQRSALGGDNAWSYREELGDMVSRFGDSPDGEGSKERGFLDMYEYLIWNDYRSL